MKGRAHALPLLLLAAASGCARPAGPAGNGIWFADGLGSGPETVAGTEASLARGGFSWALLPCARIDRRYGSWAVVRLPPPPRPLATLPVSLVVGGGEAIEAALSQSDARARRPLEDAAALAVRTAIADGARFGRVVGIHLDFPSAEQTLESYRELLRKIRSRLPRGLFLSIFVNFDPSAGSRSKLRSLASAADGVVAMVFGERARADPASADLLGRPWWAGYAPSAEGHWATRQGESGPLSEHALALLSADPRVEFRHDMEVEERVGFAYLFRARRPVTVEGRSFAVGDEMVFRQPFLADMTRRLGSDLAGRRFVRGRVVRLSGRSDSERVLTLAALNDILLGRRTTPDLRVSIARGENSITVSGENRSPSASVLSRTTNWIELDLSSAGIRDVRPGGFDRYEVYAPDGRRVSLGRAVRVRFFETLLGPFEKIEPAVILMRRPVPPGCCRFRLHLLAAAGPEFATDWTGAPTKP